MHHPEEHTSDETVAETEHIHDENGTHNHHEEEATEEEHVHDEHCSHDHHEEVSINEDEQEITAILIKFKNKMGVVTWPRIIAQNTKMQAVSPVYEVNRLFELFGIGLDALKYLAFGIMLLSGISIFISLYNRLNERKYEFALMRINGAKPLHLFGLVLTESLLLCVLGYAFGKVIGRLALYFISNSSQQNYKMSFDIFATDFKNEFLLFIITLGVGVLAALIPAIKAYTLNISKTLSHA
jgi:putative ABC transport system permease protein